MIYTIEQVRSHITNHGLLIDVRDEEECSQTGIIPGSEIIPLSQIEEAFELSENDFEETYDFSKPSKDEVIVFYCASGGRSRVASSIIAKLGFKTANYVGSFDEWMRLEEDVEFFEQVEE